MYLVLDSAADNTAQAKPSAPAAGTGSITSDPEGATGTTVGVQEAFEVVHCSGSDAGCSTE